MEFIYILKMNLIMMEVLEQVAIIISLNTLVVNLNALQVVKRLMFINILITNKVFACYKSGINTEYPPDKGVM
jgi:hypothetical protein